MIFLDPIVNILLIFVLKTTVSLIPNAVWLTQFLRPVRKKLSDKIFLSSLFSSHIVIDILSHSFLVYAYFRFVSIFKLSKPKKLETSS